MEQSRGETIKNHNTRFQRSSAIHRAMHENTCNTRNEDKRNQSTVILQIFGALKFR